MTFPAAKRASAALAPGLVALALLAAAGRASVDEPTNARGARLTNDAPADRPLFDVRDAGPTDRVVQRCIVLRNVGDLPGRVSVRLKAPPEGRLPFYLRTTFERGAQPWGAPGTGCRGFRPGRRNGTFFRGVLRGFPATPADALSDGGPALAPGESRAYRISWSVSDSPNAQGAAVLGVAFVWEVRS